MTDLGVCHSTATLEKVDPDGKHHLRGYHCPDASYQKWFQSDLIGERMILSTSKEGPLTRGNCHVHQNLTFKYFPEVPILDSAHSAWCNKISRDNAGYGTSLSPNPFTGADLNWEHKLTRPHYSDTLYQIWFESVVSDKRNFCVHCQNGGPWARLTGGQSPCRTCSTSPSYSAQCIRSGRYQQEDFSKMPDLGVNCAPTHLAGTDPKSEHDPTRSQCPDSSYLIWFESDS